MISEARAPAGEGRMYELAADQVAEAVLAAAKLGGVDRVWFTSGSELGVLQEAAVRDEGQRLQAEYLAQCEVDRASGHITPRWLSYQRGETLGPDATITYGLADASGCNRSNPGTLFGGVGSGLGYAAQTGDFTGGFCDPPPNYSGEAAASGAYGEKVTEPNEVAPAIGRALDAMDRQGVPAALDIWLPKLITGEL